MLFWLILFYAILDVILDVCMLFWNVILDFIFEWCHGCYFLGVILADIFYIILDVILSFSLDVILDVIFRCNFWM